MMDFDAKLKRPSYAAFVCEMWDLMHLRMR